MHAKIYSGKLLLDREEGATFHDWAGLATNIEIDGAKIRISQPGTYLVIVNASIFSADINSEFTEENPQPAAGPCVELVLTKRDGLSRYVATLESHDGSVRSSISWTTVLEFSDNEYFRLHVDSLSQLIKSLSIKAELILVKLNTQ